MYVATSRTEPEKMQFSLRASSVGRMWSGFEAATYDISSGTQVKAPGPSHVIVMHLAQPVQGVCRCDGPPLHRLMKPGEMDLIPLGYPAMWRDDAPGRVLNIRISPSIVQSTAEAMQRRSNVATISPKLQFNDAVLEHLCWALVNELESGEAEDRLLAESVGYAIALQLVRKHSTRRPENVCGGLSRRQLGSVLSYIREHLPENLSLVELAGVVGLSPSHFKVVFKAATGMPVHQYVIRCRVDHAVNLLTKGRTRLCDVAQQSGFAHQSHMTRCMRRVLGLTPAMALRQFWHDSSERVEVEAGALR